MKISYPSLMAFIASIMLLTACKQNTPGTWKPVPPVVDNITSTLYPAATARGDIAYFDSLCSRFIASAVQDSSVNYANVPVRAFTIRAIDLYAALGIKEQPEEPKFEHIRVYLGFSKAENHFKLFIVPVQDASIENANAGSDILLDSIGNPSLYTKTPYPPGFLNNKFVLDLNAPCPNLCDTRTPLILQ